MSELHARSAVPECVPTPFDPFAYTRREARRLIVPGLPGVEGEIGVGHEELVKVAILRRKFEALAHKIDRLGDFRPDFIYEEAGVVEVDPRRDEEIHALPDERAVSVRDGLELPPIVAFRRLAAALAAAGKTNPIVLKDTLHPTPDFAALDATGTSAPEFLDTLLASSATVGSLLCDGIGDAILIQGEEAPGQSLRLSFNILQAAGARIFKTDYVACPSCGRTLFNLQETTARIKAATLHLKGVKIAIMGCIVNGPGEMADADFGYVGGAPNKINLYIGKQPVKFNIPEAEAVSRLVDLIKEHGRWVEPPAATGAENSAAA